MSKRVAILVTDGFEQIELTSPRDALENAGVQCFLISPKSGKVQGFKHHDKVDKLQVDLLLDEADPRDYDAVLLPGGVINADALRIEKDAQRFVQAMDRAHKPILVICHAPWLLISAGLMKGRMIASWPTLQDDIRNAGGTWVDRELVIDANWISSRKPDDLPAFNRASVEALRPRREVRAEARV